MQKIKTVRTLFHRLSAFKRKNNPFDWVHIWKFGWKLSPHYCCSYCSSKYLFKKAHLCTSAKRISSVTLLFYLKKKQSFNGILTLLLPVSNNAFLKIVFMLRKVFQCNQHKKTCNVLKMSNSLNQQITNEKQ